MYRFENSRSWCRTPVCASCTVGVAATSNDIARAVVGIVSEAVALFIDKDMAEVWRRSKTNFVCGCSKRQRAGHRAVEAPMLHTWRAASANQTLCKNHHNE